VEHDADRGMFHRFRRNGDNRGGATAEAGRRSAARARWPCSVRAAGGTRGAPGSGTARRTRPACGTRSAGIGTTPRAADRSAATCAAASCRAARGSATRRAAAVCPSVRRPRGFGYGAARAAAAADHRTERPRWSEGCATDPARKRDAAGRARRRFRRGTARARRPHRAPQQNVVPQQGVTQQNQQQGASQQNRTSRTAPPPAQNIAPQQGATQQNQQGASQQNQASRMAPPPAQNIAPQQGIGQRNQDVIPQNQVSRAIPASAPRARAASDPRAFSGGVLRNQAFANLATARDPSVRTLASSTFQGRLFNPHWRRHFARPIVIGWVGPLFWPYAYHDFVDYTFYPYAYDTFWPYAYDDFYEGMFGAYGLGYGGTYASVGPRGGYDGGGYARRGSDRTAYARGSAGSRSVEADLCSGQTAGLTDWPIERIAQTVGPDDTQRAILDELKDATAKALDILQAACPTALPSTPTGRIEAMHQRLDAMLAAVRTVRPVVEKFYQSLNDEQKARFNALSPDNPDQQQAQRDLTQACNARASGVASVPLERIERAVRPDGAQRSALKELQDATSGAANLLSADCPTYRALTPVGRLQAMEQRLDAMLRAVQTVQPALEKFYGSLGDEQKERFNRLSPAQG